jgi:hypothetical protein
MSEDLNPAVYLPFVNGGDMLGALDVLCRSCNSRRGANRQGVTGGYAR